MTNVKNREDAKNWPVSETHIQISFFFSLGMNLIKGNNFSLRSQRVSELVTLIKDPN